MNTHFPWYEMVQNEEIGRGKSLPLEYLQNFSKQKGKRLRLLPSCRDYLSQSFARFYMHVVLPQGLSIP